MPGFPDVGAMRERVSLQTRAEAAATAGGTTETFTTVATVWARVEPLAVGKYIAGAQTEKVATHRITARYRSDYKTITYLLWGSVRLIVRGAVDLDAKRRFVEYLAEATT